GRRDPELAAELDEWEQRAAEAIDGRAAEQLDAAGAPALEAHDLAHARLRDRVAVPVAGNDQRRGDRQRERDPDAETGAPSGRRLDVERAADLLDVAAHDVHPDPATGDARHPLGRGKPGLEDQLE